MRCLRQCFPVENLNKIAVLEAFSHRGVVDLCVSGVDAFLFRVGMVLFSTELRAAMRNRLTQGKRGRPIYGVNLYYVSRLEDPTRHFLNRKALRLTALDPSSQLFTNTPLWRFWAQFGHRISSPRRFGSQNAHTLFQVSNLFYYETHNLCRLG